MTMPTQMLAVDHRVILIDEAKKHGRGVEDCRAFKQRVVDAYLAARERSEAVRARGGLILDPELGAAAIAQAHAAGVQVGQPAEQSGVSPLALYPHFERDVLDRGPSFIKCLVKGRPDDEPNEYRAQNQTVAALAKACAARALPLVLELIIPQRTSEEPYKFERSGRAALAAQWIRDLQALDVSPAQWKLEGFDSPGAIATVAEHCRPHESIVILGKNAPPETLSAWFKAARTSPKCVGFAVGRSIFWEPFLQHLSGASSDQVVAAIRDRYLDVAERWERAR